MDKAETRNIWRDGWLWAICIGRVFSYATFMTYAACIVVLRDAWDMTATQAGSISAVFMFGYAISLLGFSWLAERYGAKRLFVFSIAANAVGSMAFGLFARDYWSGLLIYGFSALMQGGMYTPGIMLMAERYGSKGRGAAVGALIASTSVAYAASLIVSGLMLSVGGYELAFMVTGVMTVVGFVILILAMWRVPNTIHARPEGTGVGTAVLGNPKARRLILGYTCHNWELLGMWSWAPAFLAAGMMIGGTGSVKSAEIGAYLTAVMHGVGAVASTSMGHLSDRLGRRAVLVSLAAISAVLSFALGWLVALPIGVLVALVLVHGFTALGDSPVLSTALTESVPAAYLGSALALRSLLGFGAGAAAPVTFGWVLDHTNVAGQAPTVWGPAFMVLGVGGLFATLYALRFPAETRT